MNKKIRRYISISIKLFLCLLLAEGSVSLLFATFDRDIYSLPGRFYDSSLNLFVPPTNFVKHPNLGFFDPDKWSYTQGSKTDLSGRFQVAIIGGHSALQLFNYANTTKRKNELSQLIGIESPKIEFINMAFLGQRQPVPFFISLIEHKNIHLFIHVNDMSYWHPQNSSHYQLPYLPFFYPQGFIQWSTTRASYLFKWIQEITVSSYQSFSFLKWSALFYSLYLASGKTSVWFSEWATNSSQPYNPERRKIDDWVYFHQLTQELLEPTSTRYINILIPDFSRKNSSFFSTQAFKEYSKLGVETIVYEPESLVTEVHLHQLPKLNQKGLDILWGQTLGQIKKATQ